MNLNGLTIRPAKPDDAAEILALYRHLSKNDQSPDLKIARANLQAILDIPHSEILTGWIDTRLVASCTLLQLPNLSRFGLPYALIENVVTHAEFRNNGYGKAILRIAADRAFANGAIR